MPARERRPPRPSVTSDTKPFWAYLYDIKANAAQSEVDMVFLVSIEGNIGSGKSTLLSALRPSSTLALVPEPVHEWIAPDATTDPPGPSMLDAFYRSPADNAFAFQMYVLLTRARSLSKVDAPVVITERCLESDSAIFCALGRSDGVISDIEHRTYRAWYDLCSSTMCRSQPDAVVYVRCQPEVCAARIEKRGRMQEARIDLDYLSRVHDAHERYIETVAERRTPLLVLDGESSTPQELAEGVEGFIRALLPYRHYTPSN